MKTMMPIVLAAVALSMVLGCAGQAPFHKTTMPDAKAFNAHFPDMDADSNDLVSWEEFKQYFPEAEESVYKALDLNADDAVDHDEWHEFKEAHNLKHVE